MADTRMSRAERETFLAAVRVGVLSIADDARGPLTVPSGTATSPAARSGS